MQSEKLKKHGLHIVSAMLVLVCSLCYLAYTIYMDRLVMFHDLKVELGTQSVGIAEFMTEHANLDKVRWVTDPTKVDLGKAGTTQITLRHGEKEQTVNLTVQDTASPAADILEIRKIPVSEIPEASELVSGIADASRVKVYYENEPVIPVDYRDIQVTVVVEDASGNRSTQVCTLSFLWLRERVVLELGQKLTAEQLLYNPYRDSSLLDQSQLDAVNAAAVGEYTISARLGELENICTVTVQDTTAPRLELQEVHTKPYNRRTLKDYISVVSDASGDVELRFVGTEPDYTTSGSYAVVIEAEDRYGNVTRKETTLWVANDLVPPTIQGLGRSLVMEKHGTLDFLDGVAAFDLKDGRCDVIVDTSGLNPDVAGIYYITYSSRDRAGNLRTTKRKVEVLHDEEDTAAMVRAIADTLPDDPEKIRDYVRSTIGYDHNWGGDDPIWHGFTKRGGNCYVHAMCLQSILELKGYETQMIWTTNKSHYWLLIKLDAGWRHIDATPSVQHAKISLMTDKQRLSTLNGRRWEFENWPACE